MLKYDPPTATTTPVRQVTGLGFASDLPAASPPPSPSVTDCAALLRLAQAAADRVEGSVGDLDGTLCEFAADDVPNQIWDAAANASTVLEIASANISGGDRGPSRAGRHGAGQCRYAKPAARWLTSRGRMWFIRAPFLFASMP
jgi:hypothetical protein